MDEEKDDLEYDILTLLDEEGKEHQFELVDSIEVGEEEYVALIPIYDEAEDLLNDSGELIIMKIVEEEDGEQVLDIIEDDEEYDRIGQMFMERLEESFDFDFGDEDEDKLPLS